MPRIKYFELFDDLKSRGIEDVTINCCDPSSTSFSFMRAQLKGDLEYSDERISVINSEHYNKCRELLIKAKSAYIDLVLFPEYCIQYDLLNEIIENEELWPDMMKLWCLPCEGLPTNDFYSFLDSVEKNKKIVLLRRLCDSSVVNKRKFVNACFYCLQVADNEGRKYLCLAPQIKTHNMSDPTCECEGNGLSLGKMIYTINHRLITLLCADALNNDIIWQDLQDINLPNGMLLLHPQLNKNPKHSTFCRIRQEIQSHNSPCICITCNWAENTTITSSVNKKSKSSINLSWSCFYHKRQDLPFDEWKTKEEVLRKTNSEYGLFGAFMKKQRMEVWFSTSAEQVLLTIIPNPISNQYAVTKINGITADKQLIWDNQRWIPDKFNYLLKQRIKEPQIEASLGEASGIYDMIDQCYHFPFDADNKYVVDQFFSLTLPVDGDTLMTIDEQENLQDWTLLLDKHEYDAAKEILYRLKNLIAILSKKENIPPRLCSLKDSHCFCYEKDEKTMHHTNIKAQSEKLLIIFVKDDTIAHKLSNRLIEKEYSYDEYRAEKQLGIIYIGIQDGQPHFLPKYNNHIDIGDNIANEGDITNGDY